MSNKPIPLREYVAAALVDMATVNALLRKGEPMVSDRRDAPGYEGAPPFRAWLNWRGGGRTMGPPADTVQEAANGLLRKT